MAWTNLGKSKVLIRLSQPHTQPSARVTLRREGDTATISAPSCMGLQDINPRCQLQVFKVVLASVSHGLFDKDHRELTGQTAQQVLCALRPTSAHRPSRAEDGGK